MEFICNCYKALGEIVVKKLGLEVPEDIFVKLMHLVHKDENKKGVSNNNYITAWTNSLYGNHKEAKIQKVNKILEILYPIITSKDLETLKAGREKNDPHYKEMFNKIKDALYKINSEFASLCMTNNDKTATTIELLNSKGMFVKKSGFTTSGEPVYIFTHPMIQKINSLNPT